MTQLKDSMSNIEKIKAEIERRIDDFRKRRFDVYANEFASLLAFIDSLPDENNPEPYNPVYDEDYLNEKIAKATKSWEGVDVNKMLAECRGYEEKPSEDLEEEIQRIVAEYSEKVQSAKVMKPSGVEKIARHFYELGKQSKGPVSEDLEDAAVRWEPKYGIQVSELIIHDIRDAFIAGAEWQKEQMTKEAVEGEIGYWNQTGLSIRLDQSLEKLGYDEDTKVEVIVKKKD